MASLPDPVAVPLRPAPAPDPGGLAQLLQYEAELRRRASVNELVYHIANESRRILNYGQMFIFKAARLGGEMHMLAASSLATVDRSAPLVQALERSLRGAALTDARDWDASSLSDDSAIADYPYGYWRWQPLTERNGDVFAGLLVARDTPFLEADSMRLARIADTGAHSWSALTGGKPAPRLKGVPPKWKRIGLIALVIAALFPVRLTALAPVEVVPDRPFVVAAPFAGVIARVDVDPNARVAPGQPVLTFEDVKVRNEMQQTAERLQVAKARIERATSAAFGDKDQARDIATLQAEYDAARVDYNYARELMAKSQVTAPVAGLAIYSDRRDWEGRAVSIGEPILQIADPRTVQYRIDLPAKEQLALEAGASVKIWLDAQPLWALDAAVVHASYQARPTADGTLAFAVTAKPDGTMPRIGSRGTAKLYGDRMPFLYTLLRRPIASVRQYLGW